MRGISQPDSLQITQQEEVIDPPLKLKKRKKKKKTSDILKDKKSKKNSEKIEVKKDSLVQEKLVTDSVVAKVIQPVKKATPPKSILYTESLFKNHELKHKEISPNILVNDQFYWIPIILFVCFSILVYIRTFNQKAVKTLFESFSGAKIYSQRDREEYPQSTRLSFSLMLVFVLTFSYLIVMLSHYFLNTKIVLKEYFNIAFGVTAFIYIKPFLIRMSGFVFGKENETISYAQSLFVFNKVEGLFLFPIAIFIAFFSMVQPKYFAIAGLILIVCFELYRITRIFFSAILLPNFSKFYLFLYLCTLEILPFVLIVKAFVF